MAKLEPHPVQPKHVDPERWRDVGFYYDDVSDTLTLYFFGLQHPSKVLHTTEPFDLLIDPETEEIVGYQIEGYLTFVVYKEPWLLRFAEPAGIDPERVAAIRDELVQDPKRDEARTFDTFARAMLRIA